MQPSIRLLLVDSHTLFRRCLAALLNRRRGLQVVAEAATGTQALAQARSLQPSLVVMDPEVPEGGCALIAQLGREAPGCAVLVLTPLDQAGAASRALQAGARGYLHKNCEPDELVRAIERVHNGERVLASVVADAVLKELSGESPSDPGLESLTGREREVLQLVAHGRTNPEIARELCITEHTAKGHLAKILTKLELDNRVQLATYAIEHGLVPPATTPRSRRPLPSPGPLIRPPTVLVGVQAGRRLAP